MMGTKQCSDQFSYRPGLRGVQNMMGTKQIIQQIIHMFERCVKYDGYKMSNCDRDCRRKFEMCVKRDGYKTLPSDIIIIVQFEMRVEYDGYKTGKGSEESYRQFERCVEYDEY